MKATPLKRNILLSWRAGKLLFISIFLHVMADKPNASCKEFSFTLATLILQPLKWIEHVFDTTVHLPFLNSTNGCKYNQYINKTVKQ